MHGLCRHREHRRGLCSPGAPRSAVETPCPNCCGKECQGFSSEHLLLQRVSGERRVHVLSTLVQVEEVSLPQPCSSWTLWLSKSRLGFVFPQLKASGARLCSCLGWAGGCSAGAAGGCSPSMRERWLVQPVACSGHRHSPVVIENLVVLQRGWEDPVSCPGAATTESCLWRAWAMGSRYAAKQRKGRKNAASFPAISRHSAGPGNADRALQPPQPSPKGNGASSHVAGTVMTLQVPCLWMRHSTGFFSSRDFGSLILS